MGRRQYSVITIFDDPEALRSALQEIANYGGRVINVIWTPERTVKVHLGEEQRWESGYTIIAEFDDTAPSP